jgi:membrane protein YdbS with pleckstrin-like domain
MVSSSWLAHAAGSERYRKPPRPGSPSGQKATFDMPQCPGQQSEAVADGTIFTPVSLGLILACGVSGWPTGHPIRRARKAPSFQPQSVAWSLGRCSDFPGKRRYSRVLSALLGINGNGTIAMSYVERVLQPGETVQHVSTVHWILYLPGFLFLLAGAAVFAFRAQAGPDLAPVLTVVSAILAILGLISLLAAWFRRWTTEVAVTDRRIIYKRGFIRRRTIEMNMDKVESVDVDQSVFGRIFDYGTITVRGTGTGLEPLRNIDSPIELRNRITAR